MVRTYFSEANMAEMLGWTLCTNGLHQVSSQGAARLKISFGTAAVHDLYAGVGFSTHPIVDTYAS
jgi:hypothetical protein